MLSGNFFCFGKCCLALSAAFLLDDLVSDIVPSAADLGRFADVACLLVDLQNSFCEIGPVVGSGYCLDGFAVEVAFPVVLTVDFLPGDFKDDL